MRRFRFVSVGVALAAFVAFSAMAVASSASATVTFLLASWLVGGTAVAETLLTEGSGELLLENEKSPAGKAALKECSGIGVGDVGPNSAGDGTEVLTLAGVKVSATPLTGEFVACKEETLCESSSKVWPINLPWLGEVELWEEGTESGFVGFILPHTGGGSPGFYIECKTALLTVSEECTSPDSVAELKNVATGVEAVDSDAFTTLMGVKLGFCSGNKEESAVLEGTGIVTVPGGGVLSISST